ncbi:hypothetical protein NVS55_01740 [Myxococcus stipitatus]|uniref:RCC1 domain-containing protein n=1 Tax=Myxococcus stipitatus TaxID=83455 RepID=UPI0031454FE5
MKHRVGVFLVCTALTSACLDPIQSTPTPPPETDCQADVPPSCPPPQPRGLARKVTVGKQHACALLETGGVRCWGGTGLAGDGTLALRATAVDVRGLTQGVLAVSAGGEHTCALLEGGQVRCWGSNNRFQLCLPDTANPALEPKPVIDLNTDVVALAVGGEHSCTLHATGAVMCWGNNDDIQLGLPSIDIPNDKSPKPLAVRGLPSNLTSITAGDRHTCVASSDGKAWCWGDNRYGALGDGKSGPGVRSGPVQVQGLSGPVRALTAGASHTCARVGEGTIECWGLNASGELGDDTALNRAVPVRPVGLPSDIQVVRAGGGSTCALSPDGRARCWGANGEGQLGDGTLLHRPAPVSVSDLGGEVVDVDSGASNTCAVLKDGRVQCWGGNATGQLGDGSQTDRKTPVVVQGLGAP